MPRKEYNWLESSSMCASWCGTTLPYLAQHFFPLLLGTSRHGMAECQSESCCCCFRTINLNNKSKPSTASTYKITSLAIRDQHAHHHSCQYTSFDYFANPKNINPSKNNEFPCNILETTAAKPLL
jgi:hypothetical protein